MILHLLSVIGCALGVVISFNAVSKNNLSNQLNNIVDYSVQQINTLSSDYNDSYEYLVTPYSVDIISTYHYNNNSVSSVEIGLFGADYTFNQDNDTFHFHTLPYAYYVSGDSELSFTITEYAYCNHFYMNNVKFKFLSGSFTDYYSFSYYLQFNLDCYYNDEFEYQYENVELFFVGTYLKSNGKSDIYYQTFVNVDTAMDMVDYINYTAFDSSRFDISCPFIINYYKQYDNGYNVGYEDAKNYWYQVGRTDGINSATPMQMNFITLLGAVADTPVYIIRNLLGFEIFGINVLAVFMSLLTGIIVIYFIRKFL